VSGELQDARQLCESSSAPLDDDDRHFCLALVYHALGRQADAEHELEALREIDGDRSAYTYARIYAQWHNTPAALQWLSKAEQLRSPQFQGLRVDWALDPLRNEPEFKAILARMNFPP
jgi:hypothetical protein